VLVLFEEHFGKLLQGDLAMPFRRSALCCALLLSSLATLPFLTGCGSSTNQTGMVYIAQTSLPNVVAGNSYNAALTASFGVAPYTFTVSGGALPAGLTFTATSTGGTITGTATTVGSYTFTITVKDSSGQTNSATYTVGVTGLSGQYFFYEQYYVADGAPGVKPAANSSSSHRRGWPSQAMLQQAALHPLHHSAPGLAARISRMKNMHAIPAQGSFDSSIAWGSVAGSITLDGSGNITGGEYDANSSYGATSGVVTGGTYLLNPNSSGSLSLQLDGNAGPTFIVGAHNLNSSTFADQTSAMVEATEGSGFFEYGDAQLMLQTKSALATPLSSNWVFGMRGETCYECTQSAQGDLLTAGLFNFDGQGSITNTSQADVTTFFDTDTGVGLGGTIGTTPDNYGRTTAALSTNTYDNGALPVNYAVYSIDATHAYVISLDQITQSLPPYLYGPLDQQADLTFANSTVTGNYVVWGSSEDLINEVTPDSSSDTQISLLAADGDGNVSGSGDFNYAGNVETGVAFSGSYAVSSLGRVAVSNGADSGVEHGRSYIGHPSKPAKVHSNIENNGASLVFWLVDASHGFGLQQTYGGEEPAQLTLGQQAAGTFSNGSFSGNFGLGSEFASTGATLLAAGTVSADGSGNLTGTVGAASFDSAGVGPITATYTVGANGRGTATGSSAGVFASSTFYILNSGQIVAMDTDSTDPAPGIFDILQ